MGQITTDLWMLDFGTLYGRYIPRIIAPAPAARLERGSPSSGRPTHLQCGVLVGKPSGGFEGTLMQFASSVEGGGVLSGHCRSKSFSLDGV